MNSYPKLILLSIVYSLLAIICISGCGKPLHKESEFMLGTFVEVVSPDPRAGRIVFDELKRLQDKLNMFDPESELTELNNSGDLKVSDELFEILVLAKKFYSKTLGAFDVTIAPVSTIWKRSIASISLPTEQEIKDALFGVGFDNVYFDDASKRVKFLKMGLKIDLGGIADGYAIDRAVARLRAGGIDSALINLGGDIYCLGMNNGHSWRVGVQDPRVAKKIIEKIDLADKAVSTSGDYEQFLVFQNKRYSHIIDPKSGYPSQSGLISATVVADEAIVADALSTALIVLGEEKGREVLKEFPGVTAWVIDDNDRLKKL